jgi:hypothetical protein
MWYVKPMIGKKWLKSPLQATVEREATCHRLERELLFESAMFPIALWAY